jgi:phosphopantetheinyl transferase (holo-ACP synthase)
MKITKTWEEFASPHGTYPTLILLKSKENFIKLEEEFLSEKKGSLEIKIKFEEVKMKYALSSSKWKTSISHTKGSVVGVALNLRQEVLGIGVDLEIENRSVSQNAFYRFTHSKERDKFKNLQPLEFWVMKEAAWKSNPLASQTLIPHYFIEKQTSKNKYQMRCEKEDAFLADIFIAKEKGFLFAFAISKNKIV